MAEGVRASFEELSRPRTLVHEINTTASELCQDYRQGDTLIADYGTDESTAVDTCEVCIKPDGVTWVARLSGQSCQVGVLPPDGPPARWTVRDGVGIPTDDMLEVAEGWIGDELARFWASMAQPGGCRDITAEERSLDAANQG